MTSGPSPAPAGSSRTGAAGRVAAIHAQTPPGLLVAVAFAAVAIGAGVARVGSGWWVALHLFAVGGLLSAISATTQMLAVTWSAAPAPRPFVASVQRWTVAVGAVVLVVGRETGRAWMIVAGGVTVIAAMLGLAVILIRIRVQAVTPRFGPAIEAYVAAVAAGATGMTIGILLATGRAGGRVLELRDVHLVINVFGLVGLVVVGTLPYFVATQVRSKMSPRATPTALRITNGGLVAATTIVAVGHLIGRPGIAAAGMIGYGLGLLAVTTLLPISTPHRLRWAGPRIVQLLAGLGWWAAMTLALAVATVRDTDDGAILQALVIGGFAQILVASLAYLGPVLRGGGHRRLAAGFAATRSWTSAVAGNAAAIAALVGHDPTLAVALAIWLIDLARRSGTMLTATGTGDPA